MAGETALRLWMITVDYGHASGTTVQCQVCLSDVGDYAIAGARKGATLVLIQQSNACPECDGLGHVTFFDPKRVVSKLVARQWR